MFGENINPLRAIIVVALMVCVPGKCFGQARKPCFAFILRGDVAVACEGTTSQITHRGDIEGFAVSNERPTLAYTTSRITRRSATTAWSASTTTLIDLKSGTSRLAEGARDVVSTCGGLFAIGAWAAGVRTSAPHNPGVPDLITGDQLRFDAYTQFRCSSDCRTVIGTTNGGRDLYEGLTPTTKIASAENSQSTHRSLSHFNISPDGSRIVYEGSYSLCVFSAPGPAQCVKTDATDQPSVNDSGEVLFALGTSQECYYKTSYNFSPKPFPGATDENRDQCLAIGYWRPGLKSVETAEPLGRSPQWITPATAELLRSWSAHAAQVGGK